MVLWAAPAPAQPSGTLVFGTLIQAFSYSAPLEDLRLKK